MIGPENRKLAYSVETEEAILSTSRGMASWADPTVPHTCGDCALWEEIERGGRKGQGRCRKYQQLTMGQRGAPVDRRQQACKFFDATTRDSAHA
jgi:hypothetical protein